MLTGGCDEVSRDAHAGGGLPRSNACGHDGRDNQDPDAYPEYVCPVGLAMRAHAGEVLPGCCTGEGWDEGTGGRGTRPGGAGTSRPPQFMCGPRSDYGGTTGYWDHVSGTEVDGASPNASGMDHVEG